MIASMLAAFVAMSSPTTCATIDNGPNVATWRTGHGPVMRATYRDDGGDLLRFSRAVPRAVRQTEAALHVGPRGRQIVTVCS